MADQSNGPCSFLQETLASLNNMQRNPSHFVKLNGIVLSRFEFEDGTEILKINFVSFFFSWNSSILNCLS